MLRINFEELLGLESPVGGFVSKITEPKFIRKYMEKGDYYNYSLKDDVISMADKEGFRDVGPGLYYMCHISHWNRDNSLQWNFYLIQVGKEKARCVGEFLDSPKTQWVKEAKPIIQKYFNKEKMTTVTPTKQKKASSSKSRWSTYH